MSPRTRALPPFTRVPEPQVWTGSLPVRVPLAVDPRERIAELEKALDARDGAEMAATQRAEQAEKEADRLCCERDAAIVERDDLAARVLPSVADVRAGAYRPEVRPILGWAPGAGCEPLAVEPPAAVKCLEHDMWMPASAKGQHADEPHTEPQQYEGWE